MAVDHGYERDVLGLQSLLKNERLPPKPEKSQCKRCRKCEGEKAVRSEFGAALRSCRFAEATLQCRRWRRQRQCCGKRGRDDFRLSDALRALGAKRNVALNVARRIVVEDPKRVEFRVFAQMFGHERLPPGLAKSVCNLRMAIEMRVLIVPSGASSSFAISTCVLFP